MRTTTGNEIMDRIDMMRKKKGVMLADVADAAGMNRQAFHNWRTRGTVPQADVLWNIAEYLEVEPEWLLFGEVTEVTEQQNELIQIISGCKPEVLAAVKKMLEAFKA